MLDILMIIVSIVIIILALLQSGKSDGIINALTGQSSSLFAQTKDRGSELVITRLTIGFGIAFFVLAVIIQMG